MKKLPENRSKLEIRQRQRGGEGMEKRILGGGDKVLDRQGRGQRRSTPLTLWFPLGSPPHPNKHRLVRSLWIPSGATPAIRRSEGLYACSSCGF